MPYKHLHIISFNVPYPPNYGGVIDVFYKLKALHAACVKIHLHCFEYDRPVSEELNKYCEKVYYYKRNTSITAAIGHKPYIVASRKSEELIQNLLKDDYPILFEGLHSCYYISDRRIAHRMKIYRESNIEHRYYFSLAKAEKNLGKKIYFLASGFKLKIYEKVLRYADMMLVVSQNDTDYLSRNFPDNNIIFLPSFHADNRIAITAGRGDYALYHGNLSVSENEFTAMYLIENIFNNINIPLKIAGLNPSKSLLKLASSYKNIEIIANPGEKEMRELIKNAQLNVLLTFQSTGLKLKLLNALYNGRHCLVNKNMLAGTMLEELCTVADTTQSIKEEVMGLFNTEFSQTEIAHREKVLYGNYSNDRNATKLVSLVFG